MTDLTVLRDRSYESYASTHSGMDGAGALSLIYRRQIRRHLPDPAHGRRVLDIGCGQGALVRLLTRDGYDAQGVDFSPEQIRLAHESGVTQVVQGDLHTELASTPQAWDAVIATDVLEHLHRSEVLRTFDSVHAALRPGGVFLARVPNAVSPTGGHIMHGDITHETWFTQRSVAQLAAVAGFESLRAFACPPVVHGAISAVRAALWKPLSALFKISLVAETGKLRGHIVTHNLTFVAHKGGHVHRDS